MRVLLLVDELTIGGLPNYVLDLARALAQSGETVSLAYAGGDVPEFLDTRGVTLMSVQTAAAAKIKTWAPDVVHVHLCSNQALLDGLRALGVPLLRSFHDYTSLCLRRGRRRFPGDRCQRALSPTCLLFGCGLGAPVPGSRLPGLKSITAKLDERRAYQRFELAVVGSRYMRQTLLTNGFDPGRVRLLPYFSRFDAQAQGAQALPAKPAGIPGTDRPLDLLFAGQAVAGKGLRVLVRALADLPGNWRLTAVTAGPDLEKARASARRHGIDTRIDFKDWLPQEALAGLYRQADLLVIPSVWDDPGPLVGLEALSMETPVLGFPVGGIPDYAQDGRTGFLAGGVGVAPLTAALRHAMNEGASLAEMGKRGRALVAEVHGRERHLNGIRALYRDCAREQATPSRSAPTTEDR